MGVAPPLKAPTPDFAAPNVTTIDNGNAITGWAASGTSGAVSSVARINTTITSIAYDSGTTGWATVQPASFTSAIAERSLVIVNSGGGTQETVEITEANPAVGSTTIAAIAYDSGTTGLCSIQMTAPRTEEQGLVRNSLIQVGSGGTQENVRVLSVTDGPGNLLSFRCSTVSNHAAGENLVGLASFRAYFANNHAADETLTINVVQSSITAGIGNIDKTIAIDLSVIGSQPTTDDDLLHISMNLDVPANLIEARVYLDVDSSNQDFAHNAFYAAFRQNDLQAAVSNTLSTITALQQAIQNAQIDQGASGQQPSPVYHHRDVPPLMVDVDFISQDVELDGGSGGYGGGGGGVGVVGGGGGGIGPPSEQTSTGAGQWSELLINVGQLLRVGSDSSRTLGNTAKIRVQLNVSATTQVQFGSITLRGGYGPDVGQIGLPIYYRYRGRSSVTGAKSNASPPTRYGLAPRRDKITVPMTQHPDVQIDKLDVFRFGGALASRLPDGHAYWAYAGTTANSASPSFSDTFLDSDIANSSALEFDNLQPFPDIDISHSGTCNVAGTTVTWVSGDKFNTSWAPGTEIYIGNQLHYMYNSPSSTTQLELVRCAGAQTGAAFFIFEATLLNQRLPVMWGPWNGMFFACGSSYQPGFLFGTKRNNPDSSPDRYQWEMTSPSEPLVGGIMWGPETFVCSTQRTFRILASSDPNKVIEWQEVPGGGGLWSRWAICAGDGIAKLEVDGIYLTTGGSHTQITSPELSLIFGHDGQPGQNVNLGSVTFYAVDMTQTANLRLSWENNHILFDYIDLSGTRRTIVYSLIFRIWSVDTYSFGGVAHYMEEGLSINSVLVCGADGNLYSLSGTTDAGASFTSEARLPWIGSLPGFTHVRDGYVGLVSVASLNLVVNYDGTDATVVMPATSNYQRIYTPLPPVKGRALEFAINSASAFELYMQDTFFHAKQWGSPDEFAKLNPFAALIGA